MQIKFSYIGMLLYQELEDLADSGTHVNHLISFDLTCKIRVLLPCIRSQNKDVP